MNRRDFLLGFLGGAAAAAAVTVAPTYFFAPKDGWVKNGDLWAQEDATSWMLHVVNRDVGIIEGVFLEGIPYYLIPSTSREYAGVSRAEFSVPPSFPKETRRVRETAERLTGALEWNGALG